MFHSLFSTWAGEHGSGSRGMTCVPGSYRRPGSRACPRRFQSPRIEELEARYAPSVSWSIISGVLTCTSDNSGNLVTLDHVGSETIANGIHFADSAFVSIRINGGTGHDADDLLATPAKATLVSNAGPSTVNVGKNGSVQGILSLVSIDNAPNFNTITVDDSADPTPRSAVLNTVVPLPDSAFGTISNLAPGEIEYEYVDTSSVTIKTGNAVQTVSVLSTGVLTTLVGNANETVNAGNGSVQNIAGNLIVTNPSAFTALTVNNSTDTTRHNVTMSVLSIFGHPVLGSIAGLAPASIFYAFANVSAVTVDGGPNTGQGGGFNVYTVTGTITNSSNPLTTLNVGNAVNATVNVQATSGSLTVNSNLGNLPFNVGVGGSVQSIQGALTFNNATNNSVTLDDSADNAFRSVTINDTSVVGLAPAAINYEGHTGLVIRTGAAANSITINGNSGSSTAGTLLELGSVLTPQVAVRGTTGPLNILPGSGSSRAADIIVGSAAPVIGVVSTLADIHGQLFDGEFGSGGSLVVDDEGDTTARTVTVGGPSGGAITGLAPAAIEFLPNRQAPVDILGGQGANSFTITATPSGGLGLVPGTGGDTVNVQRTEGAVDIAGHGGVDTVNLGNTSDGTASIQGTVTVRNMAGHAAINVNDAANPFAGTHVTLSVAGTLGTVSGLGEPISPFTLQYVPTQVSALTINGGSHGNVYNVQNVPSGVATTLDTGSGNDTINVGNTANTLDGILGPLTVDGQAGFDTLNINDQGEVVPHTYTINATTVVRSPGGPTITYLDIESLNLHPGRLALGPRPPGPMNNVVNVLGTDAGTLLEIDAGGGTTVHVGNEAGTLDDLQGALNVTSDDGSVHLNINDQGEGSGQDYAVAAETVDRSGAATISYSGVNDLTLDAGQGGNQIDVQSLAFGTLATVNAGVGGGQGFDLIRMRGGPINASLTLHGQGNTHLGYVAYTTPVFVDMQTGQATDVKGGFSGISTITGGSDVNILVGDGTENLSGAPGSQNLIISGGGSGLTLTGGGGAGDILIGGTTAYDADANGELEAILAEWTSGGDYNDIVAHIIAGDTDLDPYPLDSTTVFDNGAQNTLIGHPQGGEANLYYVTNNTSDDATPDETVIDVSGGPVPHGGTNPGYTVPVAERLPPTGVAEVHPQTVITWEQRLAARAARLASDAMAAAHAWHEQALAAGLAWSDGWQPADHWAGDLC